MWGRAEYKDLGFNDDTATVLEIDKVQEIIARRASRYNITLVWSNTAETAVTTNDPHREGHYTITLPVIKAPISHEDLLRTYMYVVHECGHLLRPEVWTIAIAAQPPAELMAMFNIVEDDSMERDVAHRHLGDARTLGEGNAVMAMDGKIFWEEAVAKYKEEGHEVTEESLLPMIAMAIQMMSRREWDGWSREAVTDWLKVMPVEGQPLLTDLVKEGWVDKFRNTKDEYDSWNVACDLYDRLYPAKDEEEQKEREEIREAGNTGEKRETDDGNATGKTDGEAGDSGDIGGSNGGKDTEEGDTRDSNAQGTDADSDHVEENADNQGYIINWKDVVFSEHGHEGVLPTGGAAGITFEGRVVEGGVAFMPDSMNNVIDMTGGDIDLDAIGGRNYMRRGRSPKFFKPTDKGAQVLANKVRRYVQSQSRVKFRSEREHGKINSQEITRLLLPPIDGGNWNRKVFYDHTNKRSLNTAVHILVDWSGSMAGDKQKFAAAAAMRASDVFGRCLRMPVMVSSFTTHNTSSDIAIMKHFDTPMPDDRMAENWGKWCKWSGGNADSDAVMWAYRRLMERKEPRKLLIVMSDGAPAGAYKGHGHDALLAATRHIQDTTNVELFGLGIKSDAVNMYYDNYEVVKQTEDINGALLDVLKRSVDYV